MYRSVYPTLSPSTMTDTIDWAELKLKRQILAGLPDEQIMDQHMENWRLRLLRKESEWEQILDQELLDLLQRMQTAR